MAIPLNFQDNLTEFEQAIISAMERRSQHKVPVNPKLGTLYVIGTPIGDVDGITLRAINTLKKVAIVAAETPLVATAVLSQYAIHTRVTSYGPRHLHEKIAVLITELKRGVDIALVSDSGMPVIYDPGCALIHAAHEAGLSVKVIAGPSALTAAVALAGYSGDRILFEGRLPRTKQGLRKFLTRLRHEGRTTVLFVEAHRSADILTALVSTMPRRAVALTINMERPHETVLRGRPRSVLEMLTRQKVLGKATLVIKGIASKKRNQSSARR
ncbi:putative Methyltransferase [Nitrospira sp. KM1]|uniref:16S rRNA (cytidine(1402)-2'-O)-methyltransferase n=1 Tax=Nitrospira sp. KM1 TaxID=1936990 RepID=UPI0013A79ECA|nr:SAM-dependent methyltransferase [Nitrospira sp. KM1]BCA53678.1 putative Methyltransferase [Nitrospira sp. KM1]